MNTNESLYLLAAIWTGCDRALAGTELSNPEPSHISKAASSSGPLREPGHDATESRRVVDFWREAGPGLWFAKDPAFDQRFREKFADLYAAAVRDELRHWLGSPEGALGLILLLDQYPRNSFRGTPRMYSTDLLARDMATIAIAAGHDQAVEAPLRLFLYLPYGHSESLTDQERAVQLCSSLGQPSLSRAEHHRDIIRRFARFPHRNAILGRTSRPEEVRFLAEGGFAG